MADLYPGITGGGLMSGSTSITTVYAEYHCDDCDDLIFDGEFTFRAQGGERLPHWEDLDLDPCGDDRAYYWENGESGYLCEHCYNNAEDMADNDGYSDSASGSDLDRMKKSSRENILGHLDQLKRIVEVQPNG